MFEFNTKYVENKILYKNSITGRLHYEKKESLSIADFRKAIINWECVHFTGNIIYFEDENVDTINKLRNRFHMTLSENVDDDLKISVLLCEAYK